MAVIYVIMVKNTITRCIFRRKSSETAPKRGAKLSKRTQRHAVTRFFDSLDKSRLEGACFLLYKRDKLGFVKCIKLSVVTIRKKILNF